MIYIGLEQITQDTQFPVHVFPVDSAAGSTNRALDEQTTRIANQYENLLNNPVSGRKMRRFGMESDEYFAWKLTDYQGGNHFDTSRCEAVSRVLDYSRTEVQDLAREAYRKLSLYYGEED